MTTTTYEAELKEHGWLCWTNAGASMMPLLREGRDLLVIARKEAQRCRRHDVILFFRPNADGTRSYVVHRILKVNDNGTYWVVGDNCISGEIVEENQILGVLTAVIRDGRHEVSVSNPWYRLYVHLWCDLYPLRVLLLRLRKCLGMLYRLMKRKCNG